MLLFLLLSGNIVAFVSQQVCQRQSIKKLINLDENLDSSVDSWSTF